MKISEHENFKNIFWIRKVGEEPKLATINGNPGNQVYDERLIEMDGLEYRIWDPYRSKLAGTVFKKISELPLESGSKVLYLGAASGTTASHVSDIVGEEGMVYCIEVSSRPLRDLLVTCEGRSNMIPILADALHVEEYNALVEQADLIYQDVAHPDQTEIAIKNSEMFLKDGGRTMIALKSRSIDVTKEPTDVFRNEIKKLKGSMEVVDSSLLDPYSKDHAMVLLKRSE